MLKDSLSKSLQHASKRGPKLKPDLAVRNEPSGLIWLHMDSFRVGNDKNNKR